MKARMGGGDSMATRTHLDGAAFSKKDLAAMVSCVSSSDASRWQFKSTLEQAQRNISQRICLEIMSMVSPGGVLP